MASDPRDNQNDDFDPDIFDGEEEFLQDDFDAEAFDEAEYAQDDMADDEFADDDWQDDNAAAGSYQEPREKKGLSFNTIVIIGAVVVGGGVMMMTVMNKSAEQAAGNQGMFQSFLNITGVMDGMLFGEKDATQTPTEQTGNQDGFLNNPDSLAANGNPPQPVPMSPLEDEGPDLNQPLTPLPDDMYAGVPRGPEDGASTQDTAELAENDAAAPSQQPPMSAQDILEKAMANREKKNEPASEKIEEEKVAQAPAAPVEEVVPAPEPVPTPAPTPVPVPAPVVPAPVATTPIMSPAQEKALTDNTKAMETLSESMNKVVSRIDRMEGELTNVRESQQASYQKLEATVETLKKEVTALKERPATVAPAPAPKKEDAPAEKKAEIRVPVQKTPEPVAKKPAPATTQTPAKPKVAQQPKAVTSSSARWELRAAQPGRAWISRAGAKDMQGVQVGQTVDGIGRITAITYQNGRWTVSGTGGSIHQ